MRFPRGVWVVQLTLFLVLMMLATPVRASTPAVSPATVGALVDHSKAVVRPEAASPTAAGAFVSVAPVRLVDTRSSTGASTPAANAAVAVQVTGKAGIPSSGVAAVVLTVSVIAPTRLGHIIAYADGTTRPATSNVIFPAGATISDLAVVPVGTNGKIDLYNASAASTPLVADVSGYYLAGTPTLPGAFKSVSPVRLVDTRSNTGASTPAANSAVAVQVTGKAGIPTSGVSAVVLTLSVIAPTQLGHIIAYADGTARPATSNVIFPAGATISDLAVVPVGTNGKIDLYNASAASTPLVADVSGYYLAGTPTVSGAFKSVSPVRLVDTRSNTGASTPAANSAVSVQVTGKAGIPSSGVSAVVLTLSVIAPMQLGHIIAYADGTARPATSNVIFPAGATISDLAVVPVGTNGKIDLYNASAASTPLVADVAGYYLAGSAAPSWHTPTLIDPVMEGQPSSSSCATATFCVAVDLNGDALSYNGHTWSTPILVDPAGNLTAVSCKSASFCAAVDTSGHAVLFNGTTWGTPISVDAAHYLTSVSCASSVMCIAVDSVGRAVRYNGSTWAAPAVVDQNQELTSISCASTTFCVAVDSVGQAVRFNGTGWTTPATIDPNGSPTSVSCVSASFCIAVDAVGALTFNGATWTDTTILDDVQAGGFISVSCASRTFCVAIDSWRGIGIDGFYNWATVFDGTSWGALVEYADYTEASSVSCGTSSFCFATDDDGNVFQYNGVGWSTPDSVDPTRGHPQSVSCVSASFCVAVDDGNVPLLFNGTSWSAPETADYYSIGFRFVSCVSTTFCMAVDDGSAHYSSNANGLSFDGTTWGIPEPIIPTYGGPAYKMSCASASFCMVLEIFGDSDTFDGSKWSFLDGPGIGSSTLSCPSASFCLSTIGGSVSTFNGSTWSDPVVIDPNYIVAMSCPSTTFCLATDQSGNSLTFNGTSWSVPTGISATAGSFVPSNVSCASATFCAAYDANGKAATYNGTTWSAPATIDPNAEIASISCTSATFCMAVDASGNAITWN